MTGHQPLTQKCIDRERCPHCKEEVELFEHYCPHCNERYVESIPDWSDGAWKDVRSAVKGLREDGCRCYAAYKGTCDVCELIDKWFPMFAEKEEQR